jgi:hypothetical protein
MLQYLQSCSEAGLSERLQAGNALDGIILIFVVTERTDHLRNVRVFNPTCSGIDLESVHLLAKSRYALGIYLSAIPSRGIFLSPLSSCPRTPTYVFLSFMCPRLLMCLFLFHICPPPWPLACCSDIHAYAFLLTNYILWSQVVRVLRTGLYALYCKAC